MERDVSCLQSHRYRTTHNMLLEHKIYNCFLENRTCLLLPESEKKACSSGTPPFTRAADGASRSHDQQTDHSRSHEQQTGASRSHDQQTGASRSHDQQTDHSRSHDQQTGASRSHDQQTDAVNSERIKASGLVSSQFLVTLNLTSLRVPVSCQLNGKHMACGQTVKSWRPV